MPALLPFVGVPSLDHGIAGEQYVLGGIAATGANLQRPASVVSLIRTTNANDPVSLGGFLGIPILGEPASGAWGGTHVQFSGMIFRTLWGLVTRETSPAALPPRRIHVRRWSGAHPSR